MNKRILSVLAILALTAALLAGCGSTTAETTTAAPATTAETTTAAPEPTKSQAEIDQEAADHVAELIDAIYVQVRDENTDALCAEAKAAWDALTDAQKELVEGEEADPDYFGRDTGDASLDNPGNADGIGENEILVVSFGTSFNDSRALDIYGIEEALQEAFPDWSVRRAFTAQIIINHVQAREGEFIDNMDQALERAIANGVKNLVVQPTHLMHGAEYDEMVEAIEKVADKFESVVIAEPLLGDVGSDATVINEDKETVAKAVVAATCEEAGYADAAEAAADGVAFVFMGHGTAHVAKVSYSQMTTQMEVLGYNNCFIGTVEGEPEATACEEVIEAVHEAGYTKVILRPLMVVAGDHANNDMAGEDEDSWKSMFEASGYFESVDAQIAGLGRIEELQDLYVAHTLAVIDPDQAAANKVAELIDAIYVQVRDENTDALCAAAKEAWDALTDEQKELVEGEEADPDYFGRDTGDASLDNPGNADEIGANEILVVSFGTSFNDSRALDIYGIEEAIQAAYPNWSVRRAFTAQIIINHVQAREGEFIDNMDQALERAVANGVKNLVVQPTHLMHGAEYDEMIEALESYAAYFDCITVAEPLLGEVGSDATVINSDKEIVAKAVVAATCEESGYADAAAAAADGVAFVFMGHGTAHVAKVSYSQMTTQMEALGYSNCFIGTVEGEPEATACEEVIEAVHEAGYTKVILRPLMVVAGDHANNDMAGEDEDSWKSMFEASGYFESVDAQIAGLGRIDALKNLYVAHTGVAVAKALTGVTDIEAKIYNSDGTLADGVYTVDFNTDSSMFHANEACEGKGTLTVVNGEMTVHVSLASKSILNLFPGTAEDAQKEGAVWLEPSVDVVNYKDGTSDEVHGFDIPVPALDEEFDCALIGSKGKWYDHKISVSNPELAK